MQHAPREGKAEHVHLLAQIERKQDAVDARADVRRAPRLHPHAAQILPDEKVGIDNVSDESGVHDPRITHVPPQRLVQVQAHIVPKEPRLVRADLEVPSHLADREEEAGPLVVEEPVRRFGALLSDVLDVVEAEDGVVLVDDERRAFI